MKLTVIIPVYNEASTVAPLLERVMAQPIDKEILVVDDGSEAKTQEILRQAVCPPARLFTHNHNQGKGAAICTALAQATGDVVIIQDADLEYFPEDYPALLATYEANQVKAVYGVRDLTHRSPLMRFGNGLMTLLTNLLFGAQLHDMETCYKLVDRQLMQSLNLVSRRFEIEAEISAKLLLNGIKIAEQPIRYEHRDEGKKLTPLDGLPAVATLLKYRLGLPEKTPIKQIENGLLGLGVLSSLVGLALLVRLWRGK